MTLKFIQRQFCPVCAARERQVLVDMGFAEPKLARFIDDFYRGNIPLEKLIAGRYRVVRCHDCGLIYQDPILDADAMQSLYDNWVDQDSSLDKKRRKQDKLARQYRGQLLSIARLCRRPAAQIRILEFGMGWGYWSRQAQRQGYQITGFELSQRRRAHARDLGVDAVTQLPAVAEFDCIYANQVFEHLPEPRTTLAELRDCLNPGGIIYLRVPDGRGVARQLRQQGWSPALDAIHPLEHINCFTRKTLKRLAGECGLWPVNPPLRLSRDRLWSSLKRELVDRFVTTHLFFRRG